MLPLTGVKVIEIAQNIAGPYAGDTPDTVLADRVESLVSQEHAKWASTQEQTAKTQNAKN